MKWGQQPYEHFGLNTTFVRVAEFITKYGAFNIIHDKIVSFMV